ncbi:MAG: DUF1788 domain-containing protein [Candidatus Methanoplasma sp.]|jgi:hypothetical protein|nr:DUF1788 domain-containing protein [Candidatus Methanoplasma sp.]
MSDAFDGRLDEAGKRFKSPGFRENKGLGNEVGYYVFDYPAEKELVVRDRVKEWEKQIDKATHGFGIRVFDLYEIMMDYLEKNGFLEKCFDMEKKSGIRKVTEAVSRSLKLDRYDGEIITHIKNSLPEKELETGGTVVFLTGIGKCYPIIRSHKILNNLHLLLDHVPVVMFYPGKYDGTELILFDAVKDDNYYRALPLVSK